MIGERCPCMHGVFFLEMSLVACNEVNCGMIKLGLNEKLLVEVSNQALL
jgi:hypothetical protein